MKKEYLKFIPITILSLLIIVVLTLVIISNYRLNKINNNNYDFLQNQANKVILFIGDGMGENHIKIGEKALNKTFTFTSWDKHGFVSTFSKTLVGPTDSAAAATALATGNKVYNGEISKHNDEDLTTISENAKEMGYGVGIITTDSLAGATPASFSAHAKDRGDSDDIINDQIISNIDLYLGAGLDTYKNYQVNFENNGYIFVNSFDKLKVQNNKIIGCFNNINNYQSTNSSPRLNDLVEFAVEYFETNYPNGYFIMVEGAHIDKKSHDNDIQEMIKYLDEFNNAISTVYNKLAKQNNICFIVTADHETGGLNYTEDLNQITNNLYTKTGHTSNDVKYYIYSKFNEINQIPTKIDNTEIYKICLSLLKK